MHCMNCYVIEGHDAAAKTPIAEGVVARLQRAGLKAVVVAVFHLAKDQLGHDVYDLWQSEGRAVQAITLLKELLRQHTDEARRAGCDVLLFDRHWMTVLTEIRTSPRLMEEWGGDYPPTFFIQTSPEKTLAAKSRKPELPWLKSEETVRDYHGRYLALAREFSGSILQTHSVPTRDTDLRPIIQHIAAKILADHFAPTVEQLTDAGYAALPLVAEGESKEVRYLGHGLVVIRYKPTIYSFTRNRAGIIPGSDIPRRQAAQVLARVLNTAGIRHLYHAVAGKWAIGGLVLQPALSDAPPPFRPSDLAVEDIAAVPYAPPIEVVVKWRHVGTPFHRYHGMERYPFRAGHALAGRHLQKGEEYPAPLVRMDWRNPITDSRGGRLADEILPDAMAGWYIETDQARITALHAATALQSFFAERGLQLWDLCFFITEDGCNVFSEISPDCCRIRYLDGAAGPDKDIWRHGGSSDDVLTKWNRLAELLGDGGSGSR